MLFNNLGDLNDQMGGILDIYQTFHHLFTFLISKFYLYSYEKITK